MSESAERRPSFLCLVPSWQRPQTVLDEEMGAELRRYSTTSSVFSLASVLSTTSDYGENGFLVLTATNNTEEPLDEEDG